MPSSLARFTSSTLDSNDALTLALAFYNRGRFTDYELVDGEYYLLVDKDYADRALLDVFGITAPDYSVTPGYTPGNAQIRVKEADIGVGGMDMTLDTRYEGGRWISEAGFTHGDIAGMLIEYGDALQIESVTYRADNDEPAHTHTWGEWVVTAEATCTGSGSKYRVCSECGERETRTIVPLGHKWGEWTEETPASCTESGSEKRICANDATHVEHRTVEALGHNYTATVVPPTCTERGYTRHTCAGCGYTWTDRYTPPEGKE